MKTTCKVLLLVLALGTFHKPVHLAASDTESTSTEEYTFALISSDGITLELSEEAARRSRTINNMIEDMGFEQLPTDA